MNFLKSVFSEAEESDSVESSNPGPSWSLETLVKTLADRSETVIKSYRRDIEEFGSELKKETLVLRKVAFTDLPETFDVGASVVQESLESVGQVVEDIGNTVWKSTAEIITRGKDVVPILDHDHDRDRDASGNARVSRANLCSRYDTQVLAAQRDLNTYCREPEDRDELQRWMSQSYVQQEKEKEIEKLIQENEIVRCAYEKVVGGEIDRDTFWCRYFFRIHKLKQAEDARSVLVKRVISGEEEEEEFSWDFDDNETEEQHTESLDLHLDKNTSPSTICESQNQKPEEMIDESKNSSPSLSNSDPDKGEIKLNKPEDKADNGESCKDSDFSVVSNQSLLTEGDLGWDEIEDIASIDESSGQVSMSVNRAYLKKRLSAAEEEGEVSWDMDDEDDEHANEA